jgi:hypothetical protein
MAAMIHYGLGETDFNCDEEPAWARADGRAFSERSHSETNQSL